MAQPKFRNQTASQFYIYLHIIVSCVTLVGCSIWIYFFIKGYLYIGHLPRYGDAEIVPNEGIERDLVGFGVTAILSGAYVLTLMVLIDFYSGVKMNKRIRILGIISILLAIVVFCNP